MERLRRSFARLILQRIAILTLAVSLTGYSQKNTSVEASSVLLPPDGEMLMVGEELHYNVGYSFFHLGRIVIKVTDSFERSGRTIYRAKAIIDSAPGLPFVNVHIRFTGEFDEELYSYVWTAEDSSDEEISFRRLRFEYDSSRVFFEKGKRVSDSIRVESVDTVAITAKCQDGLSLFFFARKNVRQKRKMDVPTVVESKQVNTHFNFTHEIEEEEIDSVQYPIEVVLFDGRADFVGVFGLTGGFSGRFSNDDACVPILARMKVLLGSIRIELDYWKRPGWVPPRYVEKD